MFYLSPSSNVIKYETTAVGYNQMSNRLSSAVTINDTYTQQGYVKCDDADYIHFQVATLTGNPTVVWDNVNKVVISLPASIGNVNIKSLNDGWIKAEITYTATVDSQYASIKTYFSTSPTVNTAGVPIGTIAYQTFVQVEELPYATSYIPTYGQIASRASETVSNAGDANTYNSTEGVLFVEMADLGTTSSYRLIEMSDGSNSNRVYLAYTNANNKIRVVVKVANSDQFDYQYTLTDATEFNKIAFKYKENDFALWVNGAEVYTDSSGITFPSDTLNVVSFSNTFASENFYGKTKQVQVFNTALSDAELITLTTI